MPNVDDIVKIGGILQSIELKNKEFLDRCSDTKLAAIQDYHKAEEQCRKLVVEAFDDSIFSLSKKLSCAASISAIKTTTATDGLTQDMIEDLKSLRTAFVQELLRPAVRGYLTDKDPTHTNIESLYAGAQRLDRLLEVIKFLNRISDV